MTQECFNLKSSINDLICDCLETLKLTDISIYQKAIIVRHELFTKHFNQPQFLDWCIDHTSQIKIKNSDILMISSHSYLLKIIWKLLHSATKTRIWKFLEAQCLPELRAED